MGCPEGKIKMAAVSVKGLSVLACVWVQHGQHERTFECSSHPLFTVIFPSFLPSLYTPAMLPPHTGIQILVFCRPHLTVLCSDPALHLFIYFFVPFVHLLNRHSFSLVKRKEHLITAYC